MGSKIKSWLILGLLVGVLGGCNAKEETGEIKVRESQVKGVETEVQERARIVVDFGGSQASVSGEIVVGGSVLEGLKQVASHQGLEVEVKHFDFGDLVNRIGDFSNSKEKSWIYFVNGMSGSEAANQKLVKTGDLIEWKYIKPSF